MFYLRVKDPQWGARLDAIIEEASVRYLEEAPTLIEFARRHGHVITVPEIVGWLVGVEHIVHHGHRRTNTHAQAWFKRQYVTYNPKYLESVTEAQWHDRVLDLVLHELGHLFTARFLNHTGHGWAWRGVGEIVGYAWVGSTSEGRRQVYIDHIKAARSGRQG